MECELSFICKRRGKEVWSLGIVEDGADAGNFILWHLPVFCKSEILNFYGNRTAECCNRLFTALVFTYEACFNCN